MLILATLAVIIGMGRVEETTSYGLIPIVMALGSLGTMWAGWAFKRDPPEEKDRDKDQK